MSYAHIADLRESPALNRRITACAAKEGFREPQQWTWDHQWQWAVADGWEDRWARSAASGQHPDPGADEGAITDLEILACVQAIGDDRVEEA